MAGERLVPPQKYKSEIVVVPQFFDPEAEAIERSIPTLEDGTPIVTQVIKGKRFEVEHTATSLEDAFALAREIGKTPLSNPISENVTSVTTKTTVFPIMKVRATYRKADTSS